MSQLPSLRGRWILLGACLASIVVVPLLLYAVLPPVDDDPKLQQYWAMLTPEQRTQLTENLREFRSLPAEEQARLRALHRQIEEDGRSGGQLMNTSLAFHEWLRSLPAKDAEAIQNARSKDERLELVDRFQQASQDSTINGAFPLDRPGRRFSDWHTRLPSVMGIIEKSLQLNSDEQAALNRMSGMVRHFGVLTLAHKHAAAKNPRWQDDWPPSAVVTEFQRQFMPNRPPRNARMPAASAIKMALATTVGSLVRDPDRREFLMRKIVNVGRPAITFQDIDRTRNWIQENNSPRDIRPRVRPNDRSD